MKSFFVSSKTNRFFHGKIHDKFAVLFLFSAGCISLFSGIDKFLLTISASNILTICDPILGIPYYYINLAAGALELFVAYLCLFTKNNALTVGMVVWMATMFSLYWIGLVLVGWKFPVVCLFCVIAKSNFSISTDSWIEVAVISYLVVGAFLLATNNMTLKVKCSTTDGFVKTCCPSCGGRVKFSKQNQGQMVPCPHCQAIITLQKIENVKTSCFFCNGNIEFPVQAVGRKIPCPHCKMNITLKTTPTL